MLCIFYILYIFYIFCIFYILCILRILCIPGIPDIPGILIRFCLRLCILIQWRMILPSMTIHALTCSPQICPTLNPPLFLTIS